MNSVIRVFLAQHLLHILVVSACLYVNLKWSMFIAVWGTELVVAVILYWIQRNLEKHKHVYYVGNILFNASLTYTIALGGVYMLE